MNRNLLVVPLILFIIILFLLGSLYFCGQMPTTGNIQLQTYTNSLSYMLIFIIFNVASYSFSTEAFKHKDKIDLIQICITKRVFIITILIELKILLATLILLTSSFTLDVSVMYPIFLFYYFFAVFSFYLTKEANLFFYIFLLVILSVIGIISNLCLEKNKLTTFKILFNINSIIMFCMLDSFMYQFYISGYY